MNEKYFDIVKFLMENDRDLYNKDVKIAFVNEKCTKSKSIETYIKRLLVASQKEFELKKDLFDFTIEEFEDLLYSMDAGSFKTINIDFSILNSYDKWAFANKMITNKVNQVNPISNYFANKDLLNKYISKIKQQKFITRDEMYDIIGLNDDIDAPDDRKESSDKIEKVYNKQDQVCYILAFNGIKGQANCEMVNLKEKDINFETGEVVVTNNEGESRIVIIDSKIELQIIKEALQEEEYNTKRNLSSKREVIDELIPNEYVLRQKVRTGTKTASHREDDPAHWAIINNRIKKLGMWAGNPFISTVSVFHSGMIDKLARIENKNGELTQEDYKGVWAYFGNQEKSYYTLVDMYNREYKHLNNVD